MTNKNAYAQSGVDVEAGYEVFVVTDASGTFNAEVRDAAWRRMEAAGVQLVNFFSVACELHRDWRNDMEGLAALLGKYYDKL